MSKFADFREKLFALVSESENIVITSHYSPDDDSIASVLLTYTILEEQFVEKNIKIIYTGAPSQRHSIFHNFDKITWVDDVANHLDHTDLLIILDVSRLSRISHLAENIKVQKTVTIDHHGSTPDSFTLLLIESEYSSNAELVHDALVTENTLTKELAELFLLGILGDTGNLIHIGPSQSEVFLKVKKFIEIANIRIDEFKSKFSGIPQEVIPLIQILVKNMKFGQIPGWPPFQYTSISREEVLNIDDEDISAATHIYMGQYLVRIDGYTWGFIISPRNDGTCRMSGRSLTGSVNVRDMHERLGVGGGHDRASGGYFEESDPSDCVQKVLTWMEQNKPLID